MTKRTKKFKTEVRQLLDLVIHSLYSKREIFLRELISNASDAIDRARLEALTAEDKSATDRDWVIEVVPDEENNTLTVRDNGIGMTWEEVETHIGTIANSGTRRFIEALQEKDESTSQEELIGQFGVGFYAAFMVADKVEVVSKRFEEDSQAIRWISSGGEKYSIEEVEKEGPGTDVILHLAEGQEEFLQEHRLRHIIKTYSDYIAFPIQLVLPQSEEEVQKGASPIRKETVNSQKALWKRSREEITEEELNNFYHHITNDTQNPLESIHFVAEGTTEFRALLFLPAQAPFDLLMPEFKRRLHLYVKNVFISDECKDLLPEYLRFVAGVVDSSDLPLNVSREMLQDHAIIHRMRKSLVTKTLNTLAEMKNNRWDDYVTFWQNFGRVLKEGFHYEPDRSEKLGKLLLFHSTNTGENQWTGLDDYIERMQEGQSTIYYLQADSLDLAQQSPHLEAFKSRNLEVLFLTEPIDEWVTAMLTKYNEYPLEAVDQADVVPEESQGAETEEGAGQSAKEQESEYQDLLFLLRSKLQDRCKEVRLSNRLTNSACCLVNEEGAINQHMARMMRAMGQEVPEQKRILEINPNHSAVETMKTLLEQDRNDPRLGDYAALLYDQAVLLEGGTLEQPQSFAERLGRMMAAAPKTEGPVEAETSSVEERSTDGDSASS